MFDWREYLELSRLLASSSAGRAASILPSEAVSRCAVSRAYYAAFCHARNYAEMNLGFIPTLRGSDHWLLRQHLARCGLNDIARRLRRLHGWRTECDYDDTVVNLSVKVRDALREAGAVIQRL